MLPNQLDSGIRRIATKQHQPTKYETTGGESAEAYWEWYLPNIEFATQALGVERESGIKIHDLTVDINRILDKNEKPQLSKANIKKLVSDRDQIYRTLNEKAARVQF